MDDEKIVSLYWERNEAAIRETEKKYHKYLLKIADNILSDERDNEECVNDTYLKAWNSIPPHRPEILSTYLAKITRQGAIDIFRKRNREKRMGSEYALSLSELEEAIPGGSRPEEEVELRLLAKSIGDFLSTISADARRVFVARYYFMDPIRDIARYCGISESKTKSMLHRTRRSLKTYLEKEGYDL